MDKKGLQLSGGRRRSKKYFHLKALKRSKFYRIRSDNLELITIIECISPAGLSTPLCSFWHTDPSQHVPIWAFQSAWSPHRPMGGLTTNLASSGFDRPSSHLPPPTS